MDIRQLNYFKEIVRQGSISKAAEVLHIAQPPLSQVLKKLETELGTTLIHRYRKKWELTETGKLLYQYAEDMLIRMEDVKQQIQDIEQNTAGTVCIGVSSACSNMLIDYISMFRVQFPTIKISIVTGNSAEILKKLEQREIDIALVLRLEHSGQYKMKKLKQQPTAVIIPKSWATSFSSQHITLEQVAQFPLVMLGAMEGHSFYKDLLHAFNKHHLKPNIIIECKDINMIVALVSRGLGLSIIPKMNYTSHFLGQTTLYELKQFDFSVEPVFLKLKDTPTSKAATQFWECVE
ncbi:LysR family transcriptional regulator [Desertibacillus haloalkaliphilus]|uniref:LysR family transcriptional regulator n=1 Tax=Desertibacillus haloalkaliphilus TaxID=1328930 RepID=UPI001C2673BD|nr:LysR family transcriptional regulator [Desertibacillus haloalkaliphilus]MBU8906151.1 LysR family transcriptional regulator [Desertibacillus haloalkaliphilus]